MYGGMMSPVQEDLHRPCIRVVWVARAAVHPGRVDIDVHDVCGPNDGNVAAVVRERHGRNTGQKRDPSGGS